MSFLLRILRGHLWATLQIAWRTVHTSPVEAQTATLYLLPTAKLHQFFLISLLRRGALSFDRPQERQAMVSTAEPCGSLGSQNSLLSCTQEQALLGIL